MMWQPSELLIKDKTMLMAEMKEVFLNKLDFEGENTLYFADGKRKIDCVLVAARKKTLEQLETLATFILNLERKGVHYEFENGVSIPELVFIKLHAPEYVLRKIAKIHRIILSMENDHFSGARKVNRLIATFIHRHNSKHPIYERAKLALNFDRATTMTPAERSLALSKILNKTKFSSTERGIDKLIGTGIVMTAYPLHEGPAEWTSSGEITERQLLCKYWASAPVWYKKQPLFLINKYYGPEVAFYFAFMGFYNKMLIYAAFAGIVCVSYGIVSFNLADPQRITEVCENENKLCPSCIDALHCKYIPLSESCDFTKLSIMFDNNGTVVFSIFMSFWATLTMEMWKRREAALQFKWNLTNTDAAVAIRPDFLKKAKHQRISVATGDMEAYVPARIKIYRYTITFIVLLMMVLIVLGAILSAILYRLTVSDLIKNSTITVLKKHIKFFTMISGAIINVIFIKIFSKFYQRISMHLTQMENPRTLVEFHDSCIYKSYVLSFVNNYFPYFYTAFVQGKFYSYPGDSSQYDSHLGLKVDLCHPAGCIMSLSIQLTFILVLKSYTSKIITYTVPLIKKFLKIILRSKKTPKPSLVLPQWETDYKLEEMKRFFLMKDYCEVVIQYGLVTFFVAAFPLAPFLALINNTMELRMDANKYIRGHRRPFSRRLPGIGAWNGILQAATHISTITSAFLIAFTSEFIPREYYRYRHGSLIGLINNTLSVFNTTDFPSNFKSTENVSICYYRGDRYPPGHIRQYHLTKDYWQKMLMRLLFVAIYEHIIWILTGIFAYMIPDVPYRVRKQLKHEAAEERKSRFPAELLDSDPRKRKVLKLL